jgi:hypothetical protein
MAKHRIYRKDGTPTPYFWSDHDGNDANSRAIYKRTEKGVNRMKGVRFDPEKNAIRKI